MKYRRMPIEEESPEQFGYDRIRYNLTESSVRDRSLADLGIELRDLLLFYGDHAGNEDFRDLVAAQSGGEAGGVTRDDVLVTAGAAQALFIIATSLLDKGDHLVVIRPNYATNIETPRAIEADVSFLDLTFEDGFRIDPEKLMALVTPRTKYVSVTLPHNPTGVMMERGRPAQPGRPGRERRLPPARRRDVPRDDVRRAAPGGRHPERAGDQRQLAQQDVRHPRHPHRLAGLPRRRADEDVPRRQGADRHLRQRRRRGDRRAGVRAARGVARRAASLHRARGCRSSRTGSTARR